MRNANADQLRRKARTLGWTLVRGTRGQHGCGVGDTSELAMASALKLALRNVAKQWNSAEVEQIAVTHLPMFYLAKLYVCPYNIQPTSLLLVCDNTRLLPRFSQQRSPTLQASEILLGCSMQQLKQMLVLSDDAESLTQ